MENTEKKNNLKALLIEEKKPKVTSRRATPKPSIQITGGSNIQIAGGDINHHYHHPEKIIKKTIVKVEPGIEHITESQVAELHRLKDEIIRIEAVVKQNPVTHMGVWKSLNNKIDVGKMRMIPLEKFPKAKKYLLEWIGRLNSMPSAAVKDGDEWRKRKYAYIKINAKNDPAALDAYIAKNFKATSLTELSNDELEKTYRYVASRKTKKF